MKRLTRRQREVLDACLAYTRTHGYPPSLREIQQMVGLQSVSTVYVHVQALERKGYLQRAPGSPRAMRILHPDEWTP